MNSRALPGSWSSTENALEGLAFTIKDALFVIDDFAPDGTKYDVSNGYGWHNASYTQHGYNGKEWVRKGDQIGWGDEKGIYLDPDASYRIAQNIGGDNGVPVTIGTYICKQSRKDY